MFAFARRPDPQHHALGVFGFSADQYERAVARLRAEQPASFGPAARQSHPPAITTATRGPSS